MNPFNRCLGLVVVYLNAAGCVSATDTSTQFEIGGVQISLGAGWTIIQKGTNAPNQKQYQNIERRISVGAKTFKLTVSLPLYAAIGIATFSDPDKLDREALAKQVGVTHSDLDDALASTSGKLLLEGAGRASQGIRAQLLHVVKHPLNGGPRFEIHSTLTKLGTNEMIYSRQFLFPGPTLDDIVQITVISPSKDILTSKEFWDAIRPAPKSK